MTYNSKYVDVIMRLEGLEREVRSIQRDVTEVLETDGNISMEEATNLKVIRRLCLGILAVLRDGS